MYKEPGQNSCAVQKMPCFGLEICVGINKKIWGGVFGFLVVGEESDQV